MPATHVASRLIRQITKGDKSIAVKMVQETTAWKRLPAYPGKEVEDKFCDVATTYIDELNPKTKAVAMKESEHLSGVDPRQHYTAYEMDGEDEVVGTRHFVEKEKVQNDHGEGKKDQQGAMGTD